MRVIIIPDDGEWVLVPKVATARMLTALWNHKDADSPALLDEAYRAALAAAPPEPTPAETVSEQAREAPSGVAWVPMVFGRCPLPEGTRYYTLVDGVEYGPWYAHLDYDWCNDVVTHYRLANPTPRGPCTLPPDHPHAELERLYMSDDTLKVWWWNLACWKEASKPLWVVRTHYYVGHVPPKESV